MKDQDPLSSSLLALRLDICVIAIILLYYSIRIQSLIHFVPVYVFSNL